MGTGTSSQGPMIMPTINLFSARIAAASIFKRGRSSLAVVLVQGLGASDCKAELSRRNILANSGTDQTIQRTLVAE
jgi:hypothetical protein